MKENKYDYSDLGGVQSDFSDLGGISDNETNFSDSRHINPFLNALANNPLTNSIIGLGDPLAAIPAHAANIFLPQQHQIPIPKNAEGLAYRLANIGGDIAGAALLGGPAFAARGAMKGLPLVGKLAQYLGKSEVVPSMARVALGNAGYEALTHPGERIESGLIGGIAGGATSGLGSLISKFLPSSYIKSNLSPEEIAENVRIAGDTKTGLGDILDSPRLKQKLENKYGRNPIAAESYDEATHDVATQIVKRGNSILGKYLGNTNPLEVDKKIGEALLNAEEKQKQIKNKLYKSAEERASKLDFTVNTNRFLNIVKKYKNIVNDESFLKYDPETKSLISRLSSYESNLNPSQKEGKIILSNGKNNLIDIPAKKLRLKESNILAGRLSELSSEYKQSIVSEDRRLAKIFGKLSNSLKNDITTSVSESGDKKLIDSFKIAEENYKKVYSRFLDKDIYKFTHGGKSPEILVRDFISTGSTTDQADKLNKLMSKLDPETQNLLKHSFLSRALEGTEDARSINPNRLSNLLSYKNLGQKQKNVLFPEKQERKELEDYTKLVKMNPEALSRMYNPKTGYRNSGIENMITSGIGTVIGGLGGNEEGGMQGGMTGSLLGLLSGYLAPGLMAKHYVKKFTSPKIREKIIENLLNKKEYNLLSKPSTALAPGISNPVLNLFMSPNRSRYSFSDSEE